MILWTLLFHSVVLAQQPAADFSQELDLHSTNACYCEAGNWPSSEISFFRFGCEIWLHRQHDCNHKEVVEQNTNYLNLNIPPQTGSLSIGYVGHWDNSAHLIEYFEDSILPFMQASGNSVFVDNTACNAMNDPESVSRFLNEQKFLKNQSLVARGNQATSIGTWDVILPRSDNFTAEVSSQIDYVIYPSCGQYEHHSCFDSYQKGETGICTDYENKNIQLTCCESEAAGYHWEQTQNCAPKAP